MNNEHIPNQLKKDKHAKTQTKLRVCKEQELKCEVSETKQGRDSSQGPLHQSKSGDHEVIDDGNWERPKGSDLEGCDTEIVQPEVVIVKWLVGLGEEDGLLSWESTAMTSFKSTSTI